MGCCDICDIHSPDPKDWSLFTEASRSPPQNSVNTVAPKYNFSSLHPFFLFSSPIFPLLLTLTSVLRTNFFSSRHPFFLFSAPIVLFSAPIFLFSSPLIVVTLLPIMQSYSMNSLGESGPRAVTEFSKTGLKHRPAISYNRTNEPQAPACPLRGFVCPLCDHLLSAGV